MRLIAVQIFLVILYLPFVLENVLWKIFICSVKYIGPYKIILAYFPPRNPL